MDEIDTNVNIGKFYFFKDSIKWGNEQLKSMKNIDWIIVDEVGLLEFNDGGFLPGLQSMTTIFGGHLVITIRSALIQHLHDFIAERLPSVKHWKRYIVKL